MLQIDDPSRWPPRATQAVPRPGCIPWGLIYLAAAALGSAIGWLIVGPALFGAR